MDLDLTQGNPGIGRVEGGQWDGGWKPTANDQRLVFDAGYPIPEGYMEVTYTMKGAPLDANSGKINWAGLHELENLNQDLSDADIFYARSGSAAYKYSKVKAYGKKFDQTEWEQSIGELSDWAIDGFTPQKVRFEWKAGVARFTYAKARVHSCPAAKCNDQLPIDALRFAFLGADKYNGMPRNAAGKKIAWQ